MQAGLYWVVALETQPSSMGRTLDAHSPSQISPRLQKYHWSKGLGGTKTSTNYMVRCEFLSPCKREPPWINCYCCPQEAEDCVVCLQSLPHHAATSHHAVTSGAPCEIWTQSLYTPQNCQKTEKRRICHGWQWKFCHEQRNINCGDTWKDSGVWQNTAKGSGFCCRQRNLLLKSKW